MEIKNSNIMVTGGAGFVGSHIVDQLLANGCRKIVIIDNFTRGRHENLRDAMKSGKVEVIEGDIRDKGLLQESMKGIDYVFHEAAIRITACAEKPREALEVMVDGTYNVLEATLEAGVKKIIAASSASVYGAADEFPTEESHHLYNNRTLYGATKVFNEQLFRAFNEMYGLNYIMLRYFNLYGPRMDIYGAYTEVIIRWLDNIEKGINPVIFGDGKQTMDMVYVEDVALSNILALKSDKSDIALNVATGTEISLLGLLQLILEITNSPLKPVFTEERKVNPVRRRIAATKKAYDSIGFKATTNIKEGMKKLIAWRENEKNLKK